MHETLVYCPAQLEGIMASTLSGKKNSSIRTMLLSDERFVSYSKIRDRGIVAERIKSYLQPDKILITIRNQFDILKSAYLSRGRRLLNVPDKFSGRFVTLEEWLSFSYKNSARSYIGHVDYYKTVAYYAKTFGKENISVLLFEDLVRNKEAFVNNLTDFLGIGSEEALKNIGDKHEHKEISQSRLDFERFKTRISPVTRIPIFDRLAQSFYLGMKRTKKDRIAEVEIPGPWLDRLGHFYKEGNRKLVEECGLPLERYGYPL